MKTIFQQPASLRLSAQGVLVVALLAGSVRSARGDDELGAYRNRFRLAMEKYKAGAAAEAIRLWTAIYEEMGPKQGYRLSFNLGRAYDANGEATRASERYRSFLEEVSARQARGETVDPLVLREVREAEGRLSDLNQSHGRIEIDAGNQLAQVDDNDPRLGSFTAYVAPGKHVVTFGPASADAEKVEVSVNSGEVVAAHATRPVSAPVLPPVDPVFTTRQVAHHPFTPVVLYVGGVLTVASVLAPVLAYTHAHSLLDEYNDPAVSSSVKNSAASEYYGDRTLTYGLYALPLGLAAVTGGLATWYFAGTEERTVTVSLVPHGLSLAGRF